MTTAAGAGRPFIPTIPFDIQVRYKPIPDGLIDVEELRRNGIDYHKKYDLLARLVHLREEVLDASDATPRERAFLLRQSEIDPSPLRRINYGNLIPGATWFEPPELLEYSDPEKLKYDALLIRARRFLRGLSEGEKMGSSLKRQEHLFQIQQTVPLALFASTLDKGELEAIWERTDSSGNLFSDPQPNRLPKYRLLVPANTH